MRKLLASIFSIFVLQVSAQQVVKCFTDEHYEIMLKENPQFAEDEMLANQTARLMQQMTTAQKKGTIRYIPVVFHVIHKNGFENISQTQINDAIRILNEDFRKKTGTNGGSSTDPLAVDFEYEFRLAQFNPNGQPTNGVNRIYSTQTDNARDAAKALSYWDKNKYFNIWVVNTIQNSTGDPNSIVLGYAQFPFTGSASTDGVVIRADQCGIIEIGQPSQAGRTLTHEAGHWVGLYHPFQGGCNNSNCNSQGDQVCDTPPVASATNGCPNNRNSCATDAPDLPDMVRNYMDYADGTCMNLFTPGQKSRADAMMAAYRSNIYGTSNISAAGLNADGSYKALTSSTVKAPYSYGFETNNLTLDGWKLENYTCPGDSGWNLNTQVAFNGSKCIGALNNKVTRLNVRNAFVSPSIDVTNLNSPTLSFYVAYCKKLTVSQERVKVFVSNSYGREEVLVKQFVASDLESASIQSADFFPNGSGQWKRLTLDLSDYKSYNNLSVRIELTNLRGNNIFIDDFSISEPTGISDALKQKMDFKLYPNPAFGSNINLSFNNLTAQEINVTLLDISGKEILASTNNYMPGAQNLQLLTSGLKSGVYFVNFKTAEGTFTEKVILHQ